MVVLTRDLAFDLTGIHPCDLELRLIDEVSWNPADPVLFRAEPGLHDQHAAGPKVPSHICDGALQHLDGLDVTDGTEEGCDDIKAAIQLEVHHISLVKGNARGSFTSNRKDALTEIDALHLIMIEQIFHVFPCAACYVGERSGAGIAQQD